MKRIIPIMLLAASAAGCGSAAKTPMTSPAEQKPVQARPEGYFSLTPGLTVPKIDEAIAFYEKALGAQKIMALNGPDGSIMHAEIKIGDSALMLGPENPEWGTKSPATLGGSPASLMLYVEDVDAAFNRAVAAGAKAVMPVEDQFWGDRYGMLVDPYGHRWAIATHKEDLTSEQMVARAQMVFGGGKGPMPAGTPAKSPIPAGYHSITPSLVVKDASAIIEFYKKALGATERHRMAGPDGRIMHAEVQIGDSILMLSDEFPEMGATSPATLGGSPVQIMIYVDNVDSAFDAAVQAGATIKQPVQDMFWGDRFGEITDPSGHPWGLATHKEDLTPEQIAERMKAQYGN